MPPDPNIDRRHLIALDDAVREYHVGEATLWRYLRRRRLSGYEWLPDRRRFLDRRELDRLFTPRLKE